MNRYGITPTTAEYGDLDWNPGGHLRYDDQRGCWYVDDLPIHLVGEAALLEMLASKHGRDGLSIVKRTALREEQCWAALFKLHDMEVRFKRGTAWHNQALDRDQDSL